MRDASYPRHERLELIEDRVYCVVCRETYSRSQMNEHISKHQRKKP